MRYLLTRIGIKLTGEGQLNSDQRIVPRIRHWSKRRFGGRAGEGKGFFGSLRSWESASALFSGSSLRWPTNPAPERRPLAISRTIGRRWRPRVLVGIR